VVLLEVRKVLERGPSDAVLDRHHLRVVVRRALGEDADDFALDEGYTNRAEEQERQQAGSAHAEQTSARTFESPAEEDLVVLSLAVDRDVACVEQDRSGDWILEQGVLNLERPSMSSAHPPRSADESLGVAPRVTWPCLALSERGRTQ
jgi:hypothetical protein